MALLGYLACALLGAALALLAQVLLLAWYVRGAPEGDPIPDEPPPDVRLPKEVVEAAELHSDEGDCAAALSLALQFLFQERKRSPAPLAWLRRKLQQEMAELLTRSASGKLFESLSVRGVSTGDSAPRVRWAGVQNVETLPDGRLGCVDLILDVLYSGGFQISVDAALLIGKTARFDVEVERLSGRARVRFAREPYTHWSLSFLTPPRLELRARPLRGRLSALVQAHARRALRRKHTLPNYTIRYRPFFVKEDPSQPDAPSSERRPVTAEGALEVTLLEVTRLLVALPQVTEFEVRCTISLDSSQWVCFRREGDRSVFTLDLIVRKERDQQLGASFRQAGAGKVVVDAVVPLGVAYRADLRRDDVVVAVDGKTVTGINHVAKAVKAVSRASFAVRVERKTRDERDEDIRPERRPSRKPSESIERSRSKDESDGLRKRRCSVENKSSSESSGGSTPAASQPGTPSKNKGTEASSTEEDRGRPRPPLQTRSATPKLLARAIPIDERMTFDLNKNHRFVILNVWGRSPGSDEVLLAYLNVPLSVVLEECRESENGRYERLFALLPPDADAQASKLHPLADHSGFEPCLCYGDALLRFSSTATRRIETRDEDEADVEDEPSPEASPSPRKKHRFARTHFERSTQCDYCGKKIWLKDAAQCKDCGLRCHKKCVAKCLGSERCEPSSVSVEDDAASDGTQLPEFLMTEHSDDAESPHRCDEEMDGGDGGASLGRSTLTGLLGGLRRAGSAHCLSPSSFSAPAVRSLPPSPQRSPGGRSLDGDAAWAALGFAFSEGVSDPTELLEPLLAAGLTSDALLSGARDAGPLLLARLPDEERADRISKLISDVKSELSGETEIFKDGRSADEERTQALTALLLHCCSAMRSVEARNENARDQ